MASILLGILALISILHCLGNLSYRRSIRKGTDTVLITGASSGMGLVTALYLCDKIGFQVFATVRKSEDGEKIIDMVKNKDRMKILILDVTKPDTINKAVDVVSQAVGDTGLYGLFNNAGTATQSMPCEYADYDSFKWLFDVNTIGALRVTNAFLPLLRKASGTIINNTSVAGFSAASFFQPYSCTKFALESISDSQRKELRSSGVRVVVLECALVMSSIAKNMCNAYDKEKLEKLLPKIRENYPAFLASFDSEQTVKMVKMAASAEVVAVTIDKALRGSNPKTRYVIGGLSGIVKWMHNFSDKTQDFLTALGEKNDSEAKVDLSPPSDDLLRKFSLDPFFAKYNYNRAIDEDDEKTDNTPLV